MGILGDLKMYGRFALELPRYLKHTLTLEEAKTIVKKRMEERERNFLRLIKKGVFDYPRSPYLPLMELAHCEMEDVENMIRNKGLEPTLRSLRKAGVYITFEEFKGRKPVVRNGQVFHTKERDFDNPYLKHYYDGRSGGTTGAGTRVTIDLDHLAAQVPNLILAQEPFGVLNATTAMWFGVFPDDTGVRSNLLRARLGNLPRKWFSPISTRNLWQKNFFRYHFFTPSFVLIGRISGVPIPWPEPVPLDQAIVVARWAADTLRTHRVCLILAHVSMAMRVCVAAREHGLDLSGAVFWVSGEPPTPAKVRVITQTGARFVATYAFAETGGYVGSGCARPADCNDIHLFKDILALIQHPRELYDTGVMVDAFHFTTLLPTAPKLMLNVESDDYGVMETRSCGCPLESYGYTDHLRDIRSFRKLTGEGVTLVGSEMIHILEEVLPARFGGSPLDYQLMEEEDEQGFTRLSLLISPRVGTVDEQSVIDTVLETLRRSSVSADLARAIWSQTRTLRVKRMEPIWTARGKLMPLHLLQRSQHKMGQGGDE